ncbi:hypothetical protein LENED_002152 [Lentinula edodes]|uniref:Uncharacterized protein n=1 Tax=Lentinula edodes TaxID=5353 RepID=A0A1Q3E0C5_LENED|nr:hypothetical protein LENED_002152 [Lentinula edodes]
MFYDGNLPWWSRSAIENDDEREAGKGSCQKEECRDTSALQAPISPANLPPATSTQSFLGYRLIKRERRANTTTRQFESKF